MLDSWLMKSILNFNPKQLILVGDQAQLPPVGKGQPFHDLIKLRPDIVSTLRTCHRAKGAVHMAALAIREGKAPESRMVSGGETWTVMKTGEPAATIDTLIGWIKAGRFDPMQDMIVAPRYGTAGDGTDNDGGINEINRAVKAVLNPSTEPFAVGDRVLICKNFSDDDLWNGDIGTLTDMDSAGLPEIEVDRAPGDRKQLTKEHVREMKHAYCLSVHKAQGSQARRVFFCVFKRHFHMLTRPLIYTAITRARQDVVVMGEPSAFYHGIKVENTRATVMQVLAAEEEAASRDPSDIW
jgi:exodeoxyribonuclease V alpha subunit